MENTKYDSIKGTLRSLEGIIEVLLLSVLYYFVWKFAYVDIAFVDYEGGGKYVWRLCTDSFRAIQ